MSALCVEEHTPLPDAHASSLNRRPTQSRPVTSKTPVKVDALAPWLNDYLDRWVAEQLRCGFTYGFFITFILSWSPTYFDNLKSARDHGYCWFTRIVIIFWGANSMVSFITTRVSPWVAPFLVTILFSTFLEWTVGRETCSIYFTYSFLLHTYRFLMKGFGVPLSNKKFLFRASR